MTALRILVATIVLSAAASFVLSVWLYFANDGTIDDRLNGIFVGVWVPSILGLGTLLLAARKSGRENV
jgi:hypothetical protein